MSKLFSAAKSLIGGAAGFFTSTGFKIAVILAVIGGLFFSGYYVRGRFDAEAAEKSVITAEKSRIQDSEKEGKNNDQAVAIYWDASKNTDQVSQTIIPKVLVNVPDNDSCRLSVGTLRLLNYQRADELPTPGSADDLATKDPAPSTFGGRACFSELTAVTKRYNESRNQCNALIDRVKEYEASHKE